MMRSAVAGFVCLLMVSAQTCIAQIWREAIAITSAGDTLRGQANFEDPDISPSSLEFRDPSASSSRTLSAAEVHTLFIPETGKQFESLTAEIELPYRVVVPEG